jgi:hypothetical protein
MFFSMNLFIHSFARAKRMNQEKARPSGSLNFLVSFMFAMTCCVRLSGKLTFSKNSTRKFFAPTSGDVGVRACSLVIRFA